MDPVHHSVEIDVDHPIPHAHRSGPLIAHAGDSGVVAQHMGRAVLLEGAPCQLFETLGQADVDDHRQNVGAVLGEFGGDVAQLHFVDIGQHDFHARGDEAIGHRPSDAAGGPRDDRYFPLEFSHPLILAPVLGT